MDVYIDTVLYTESAFHAISMFAGIRAFALLK